IRHKYRLGRRFRLAIAPNEFDRDRARSEKIGDVALSWQSIKSPARQLARDRATSRGRADLARGLRKTSGSAQHERSRGTSFAAHNFRIERFALLWLARSCRQTYPNVCRTSFPHPASAPTDKIPVRNATTLVAADDLSWRGTHAKRAKPLAISVP